MSWLKSVLRGGGDELGWDDLIRRIVDAIATLKRFGPKGDIAFPDEVIVRITVAEGGVAIVQGFVDRPELDREVSAALANKCDVAESALPARSYIVSAADRTSVTASEGAPKSWRFVIAGGDRDGGALPLPVGWTELGFGRGDNDLVVCDKVQFVSRRAGRFYRAGNRIEVAAQDQADELIVRRAAGGQTLRPARTARGRVVLEAGDSVELGDGRGGVVRLVLERI